MPQLTDIAPETLVLVLNYLKDGDRLALAGASTKLRENVQKAGLCNMHITPRNALANSVLMLRGWTARSVRVDLYTERFDPDYLSLVAEMVKKSKCSDLYIYQSCEVRSGLPEQYGHSFIIPDSVARLIVHIFNPVAPQRFTVKLPCGVKLRRLTLADATTLAGGTSVGVSADKVFVRKGGRALSDLGPGIRVLYLDPVGTKVRLDASFSTLRKLVLLEPLDQAWADSLRPLEQLEILEVGRRCRQLMPVIALPPLPRLRKLRAMCHRGIHGLDVCARLTQLQAWTLALCDVKIEQLVDVGVCNLVRLEHLHAAQVFRYKQAFTAAVPNWNGAFVALTAAGAPIDTVHLDLQPIPVGHGIPLHEQAMAALGVNWATRFERLTCVILGHALPYESIRPLCADLGVLGRLRKIDLAFSTPPEKLNDALAFLVNVFANVVDFSVVLGSMAQHDDADNDTVYLDAAPLGRPLRRYRHMSVTMAYNKQPLEWSGTVLPLQRPNLWTLMANPRLPVHMAAAIVDGSGGRVAVCSDGREPGRERLVFSNKGYRSDEDYRHRNMPKLL